MDLLYGSRSWEPILPKRIAHSPLTTHIGDLHKIRQERFFDLGNEAAFYTCEPQLISELLQVGVTIECGSHPDAGLFRYSRS